MFSGIGGIDLGLQWAGMETAWFVECEPFCQKVLSKHWPDVPIFGDIYEFIEVIKKEPEEYQVELVAGGFPCQPFSVAGKRKGQKDDRYLWPAMLEVIKTLRPAWVLGENVVGIVKLALDDVLSDLEGEGYACQAFIIPACAVNAPHRRDRIWIVAYSGCELSSGSLFKKEDGMENKKQNADFNKRSGKMVANANNSRCQKQHATAIAEKQGQCARGIIAKRPTWATEPDVGRVANGIPNRVDRLRALGNAVVPQVVYEIGKAIIKAHEE